VEIRIEWSELSERQLKDIYDYHALKVSPRIAGTIINRIFERVSILEHNTFEGPKEELLKEYPENYRYLVEGNYKIIYWKKENLITITSVFDSRQNPDKMRII
jgi:toxin ParE1/3/4